MTNKFFKLLQPTIVKTSDDEFLPQKLRNRFLVNYNVIAISYFEENYILGESEDGEYFLLANDNQKLVLENSGSGKIIDIPRLYIDITDKFINGAELFQKFISLAIKDNSYYASGIDGFVPGEDYWLNGTLNEYISLNGFSSCYISEIELPNYLEQHHRSVSITKYFCDLSDTYANDYSNLEYYKKKNREQEHEFAKEELMNFYANFCKQILEKTMITEETRNSGNNLLYNIVLNYFANYQSDEALNAINIVLNNLYSTSSSNQSCSCNSTLSQLTNSNNTDIYTKTCSTLYEEAMNLYIEQMFGDVQFYHDWFNIELSEYDCIVNDLLVETLIKMLTEFIDMDFNLNFDSISYVHSTFNCGTNLDNGSSNYKILENYLKVLKFIESNDIVPNTNKIKIWGGNFGKLLPSLQL